MAPPDASLISRKSSKSEKVLMAKCVRSLGLASSRTGEGERRLVRSEEDKNGGG